MTQTSGYEGAFRRVLVDMQIPDWDAEFFMRLDPCGVVDAACDAGAQALMVYFQSHTGLCNWPTRSGVQHAAFAGRDPIAQLLEQARARAVPVCAYYSVCFNNQAWIDNPAWRSAPAAIGMIGGGLLVRERYGVCCLNNPDYRKFIEAQVTEILTGYDVAAFFFDMVWWMDVCLCQHCSQRFKAEYDSRLPEHIDWLDSGWCRFQAARERWLSEFAAWLRELVQQRIPGLPVYHNFALCLANWTRGVTFDSASAHDFLGGDFYGGAEEQLLATRLMLNLSERGPVEFMTTVASNLAEHETLKSADHLNQQVLTAAANSAASLLIAAIDPDGQINPGLVDRIREAFGARSAIDDELGGVPVEQIGVYFSDHSKMSFADNGNPLAMSQDRSPLDYPHLKAVRGACSKLQQAHLPFGVITSKQLDRLDEYDVIVLPNILRITLREVEAIRAYVLSGGSLYASEWTSITTVDGCRHDDFLLSDLFGCSFDGVESGRMVYLQAESDDLKAAILPQRFLRQLLPDDGAMGVLKLRRGDGKTLATLNTPYAHPSPGSIEGEDFASIHSSPPWTATGRPVIISKGTGDGRVVYSAADIESDDGSAHKDAFLAIIYSLLKVPLRIECDAHPSIWLTAFHQENRQRFIVGLLDTSQEMPHRSSRAQLRMVAGQGQSLVSITDLIRGRTIPFEATETCDLQADISLERSLELIEIKYEHNV